MNREIKFRAWDGERLRLVWGLGWIDGELDTVNTPKYHGPVDEDVVIMQYTGLKDKNGVEIYEGDILTTEHYPFQDDGEYNYHGLVEWGEEEAAFYLTKYLANNSKRGISHGISEMLGQEDVSTFEIIGNIYEQPHLLEDKP